MPSARQTAALARSTAQVHADHAGPVRIGATTGTGIYSAARFTRTLEEGGMKLEADCTVRLLKADWTAYTSATALDGKVIELWLNGGWTRFHASNPQDIHASGEWKLDLEPLY